MQTHPLTDWLDNPDGDRGVHFGMPREGWSFWSYAQLAERSRAAAGGLRRAGIQPGEVITIVGRSDPDFVAAFFAILAVGATPSPVAPPIAFQEPEAYLTQLAGILATARPAAIIAQAQEASALQAIPALPPVYTVTDLLARADQEHVGRRPHVPGGHALLQFTSGSSGSARGVRISIAALEANIEAIHRWLRWNPEDPFASWLPLNHDMGLTGGLLSAIVARSDLWLLPPEEFVRAPARYLHCLGTFGARLTVTPCFGLSYLLRRVAPEALEELDFSGLRGMVIGAERIDARVLDDFARLLAPNGLDRRALLPAYGLAEATLAVTGLPVDEGWSSARLDPSSLVMDERIASLGNGGTVEAVQGGVDESAGGTVVVGCGRPLAGVVIAIASENGASLPELHVGEIVVRGASLADGYVGDAETTLTRLTEGTLWTGDAGFLLDGQLYVLGRLGDSMKVRGRVVFSEDLEVGLAAAGAPRQRIAVLLGVHAGNPTVVLLVEDTEPSWRSAAEALLHQRTDGAVALIITVPRGTIARTSSGKPRRRYLWQAFVAGECTQPIPPRMPSEAAIPGPPPAPGQIAGDAGASAVTPMTTHRYSND